jgi:hypothetical protein
MLKNDFILRYFGFGRSESPVNNQAIRSLYSVYKHRILMSKRNIHKIINNPDIKTVSGKIKDISTPQDESICTICGTESKHTQFICDKCGKKIYLFKFLMFLCRTPVWICISAVILQISVTGQINSGLILASVAVCSWSVLFAISATGVIERKSRKNSRGLGFFAIFFNEKLWPGKANKRLRLIVYPIFISSVSFLIGIDAVINLGGLTILALSPELVARAISSTVDYYLNEDVLVTPPENLS